MNPLMPPPPLFDNSITWLFHGPQGTILLFLGCLVVALVISALCLCAPYVVVVRQEREAERISPQWLVEANRAEIVHRAIKSQPHQKPRASVMQFGDRR